MLTICACACAHMCTCRVAGLHTHSTLPTHAFMLSHEMRCSLGPGIEGNQGRVTTKKKEEDLTATDGRRRILPRTESRNGQRLIRRHRVGPSRRSVGGGDPRGSDTRGSARSGAPVPPSSAECGGASRIVGRATYAQVAAPVRAKALQPHSTSLAPEAGQPAALSLAAFCLGRTRRLG